MIAPCVNVGLIAFFAGFFLGFLGNLPFPNTTARNILAVGLGVACAMGVVLATAMNAYLGTIDVVGVLVRATYSGIVASAGAGIAQALRSHGMTSSTRNESNTMNRE